MKNKSRYLEDLKTLIEEGEVDLRIIDTLNILNSKKYYYTTSSCAGRLILIELEEIGGKKESKFIFKSHEQVDYKDIWNAISEYRGNKMLFLLINSPIIHVVSRDLESAKKLIDVSKGSGFKYSSVYSLGEKIIVEIKSTEKMDVPVVKDGKVYPNKEYVAMLVEMGNILLDRIRKKIEILNENLRYIE